MAVDLDLETRIRSAGDAGDWERATTIALEGYGAELLSYLVALLRNASDADDVFGNVCENLWRSLPRFRWASSFRTYAYAITRHAYLAHARDPRNRARGVPLSSPSVDAVFARLRSHTATFLRTETRDKIDELRAQLEPEDQTLLILRVNRRLAWRDIATIMADPDDTDETAATRRAAALRKRFERLKVELRAKATQA